MRGDLGFTRGDKRPATFRLILPIICGLPTDVMDDRCDKGDASAVAISRLLLLLLLFMIDASSGIPLPEDGAGRYVVGAELRRIGVLVVAAAAVVDEVLFSAFCPDMRYDGCIDDDDVVWCTPEILPLFILLPWNRGIVLIIYIYYYYHRLLLELMIVCLRVLLVCIVCSRSLMGWVLFSTRTLFMPITRLP